MTDTENPKRKEETEASLTGQYDPSYRTEFVRERIKQKPVSRRKLLQRTLTTVLMAAVFGMVACLTFLLLEPIINNWLNPKEQPQLIILEEETEEVMPEDLYVDDFEMQENVTEETDTEGNEQSIISGTEFYEQFYGEIKQLVADTKKAVVTVATVTSDVDWFDNTYENINRSSGIIVGNNGRDFLILVHDQDYQNAENIEVNFCDGTVANARFVGRDSKVQLAVVAVSVAELSENTMDQISIAKLGSSNNASLKGTPVIAIGNISGYDDSYSLGMISAVGASLNMVDSDYKRITTDIYGSTSATGILVNMKGLVLGMVDQTYADSDTPNLISGIGITELKRVIEKMSNEQPRAFLGIYGADVPDKIVEEQQIPKGVYISAVEIDSPAMKAGLQSGDIICKANAQEIRNYRELIYYLHGCKPEQSVVIKALRQHANGYAEIEITVTLDTIK